MSIQTTFNKNIQGTNFIYGDIISNNDASLNNLNINGKLHQTNTGVVNNILGNTTIGNSTDSRGILTNNFNSTITKSNDIDIQDANRAFCNDNVSTTTTNNMISAICLQLAPTLGLTSGRAIGDIMLIRENNTTSSFMLSAFQGNNYRDLMKIAVGNSFIRSSLNIGSTNTSYSDKLNVEGTAMIGNNLRMYNVSPIQPTLTANDVIQFQNGTINYCANSINTSTHTSTDITHKVNTEIQGLVRVRQNSNANDNVYLNGNHSSVNNQGLWLEWSKNGDGKSYYINQKGTAGTGGFIWGESTTSNVLTPLMELNQTNGIQFFSPLYQGSYQRKAYFSSTGALNNYPTWTTLSYTNNTGSITHTDIVVGGSSPYLDFINFNVITIRFQGFQTYTSPVPPNRPFINGYLLKSGIVSTDTLNQNILRHSTNSTTFTSMTNPSSNHFRLMESIECNIPNRADFSGEVILQAEWGGGFQIRVNGSYSFQSIGQTNIFGSVRSSIGGGNPVVLRGYNGFLFQVNNIDPNTTINFRYYIDAT